MPKPRPTVWQRDMRRLRTLAVEIVEQVYHFNRNTAKGSDDTIRSLLIDDRTRAIGKIGARMARRWERAKTKRDAERGQQ